MSDWYHATFFASCYKQRPPHSSDTEWHTATNKHSPLIHHHSPVKRQASLTPAREVQDSPSTGIRRESFLLSFLWVDQLTSLSKVLALLCLLMLCQACQEYPDSNSCWLFSRHPVQSCSTGMSCMSCMSCTGASAMKNSGKWFWLMLIDLLWAALIMLALEQASTKGIQHLPLDKFLSEWLRLIK